jgi:hypothetical protein
MNLLLPVPTGHTQKPVTKDEGDVELVRRPNEMSEGATKVAVAIFGGGSGDSSLLTFLVTTSDTSLLLTLLLYAISFSTALTELVIFHPPLSLKSSSTVTTFSTPSALYQLLIVKMTCV